MSAAIKVATESRLYAKRGAAVPMTPGRSGLQLKVHTRRDDRGPVIGFQLTRPTGEEVGAPIMIWGDQLVALARALDWLSTTSFT